MNSQKIFPKYEQQRCLGKLDWYGRGGFLQKVGFIFSLYKEDDSRRGNADLRIWCRVPFGEWRMEVVLFCLGMAAYEEGR